MSLEKVNLAIVVREGTVINSEGVESTEYLLEENWLVHRLPKLIVELQSLDVEEVVGKRELILRQGAILTPEAFDCNHSFVFRVFPSFLGRNPK